MRQISYFLIFISVLSMGFKNGEDIDNVLKLAGKNKIELEKVIKHYEQNSKDVLKLRAAHYLIKNMPRHYGLYKSEGEYTGYDKIPDVEKITSMQLIENIDFAFLAWKLPWAKHLNFQEFCEYVLPYRFDNEVVESWRPQFFKRYSWLTDSMKTSTDPIKACEFVNNEIKKWFEFNGRSSVPNCKSASMLLKDKGGRCIDQAAIATYAMRAVGIPIVHEYIPNWGNRNFGHDFSAVLNKEGDFVSFLGGELAPGKNEISDQAPKIYRKNYSSKFQTEEVDKSPIEFGEDVTNNYINVSNVRIDAGKVPKDLLKSNYLCVFDNKNWIPICRGTVVDNNLLFRDVGRNIVYLCITLVNNKIVAVKPPFLLQNNGEILPIQPADNRLQTLKITRKYPIQRWWKKRLDQIKGGIFQASDDVNFSKPIDIHLIDYPSKLIYHNVDVKLKKAFRYWRLYYPDTVHILPAIAEIELYGEKHRILSGEPITVSAEMITANLKRSLTSTKDSLIEKKSKILNSLVVSSKQFAFDHNPFSVFRLLRSANYIGIDFGQSVSVEQIKFLTENDDNAINDGEIYELSYWNDGDWQSLGETVGDSEHQLDFQNVPSNGLYLLRNLTKGSEHRIFTVNNGQQVWW